MFNLYYKTGIIGTIVSISVHLILTAALQNVPYSHSYFTKKRGTERLSDPPKFTELVGDQARV